MQLFDVYPLFDIELVKAQGIYLWDEKGQKYLDLYGGHAVISIGHSHPHYVRKIKEQLDKIAFFSNSIQNSLQKELAQKLGQLSGYEDYQLFFCNSGAEANENALKLASFYNQRKKIVAFDRSFHGRTSAAVAVTDNPKIIAPINASHEVIKLPFDEPDLLEETLNEGDVSSVIIEGIQGVGGVYAASAEFMQSLSLLCKKYDTLLILDEIQSGYGRSGKFFAHQYAAIQPDLITVAKGMGNGFPMGGVLIHPGLKPWHGMLGTTFGGNHLGCAAGIAVLDIIKEENLMQNALNTGNYLKEKLSEIQPIKALRGAGLMLGIEFDFEVKEIRKQLLMDYFIFTGASGNHVIRLLPPLGMTLEEADIFIVALKSVLKIN
ncbi:MAG: aminotransferase class III-fold pyridoxal phosphate-dependent enzyme [Microscillaceae bacterium]|nr:aminotransferase class III-fold pyridoxal phosphate-dependent enzyme [Microscillaceae bacterium]